MTTSAGLAARSVAEYAELYADQNDADYERLLAAETDGALEVRREA